MADWPYNTTAWRKLRLAKLAADPLCYACGLRGLNKPARAVDHIHSNTKGFGRSLKGFDLQGNPIDPADDWHGGWGYFQSPKRQRQKTGG